MINLVSRQGTVEDIKKLVKPCRIFHSSAKLMSQFEGVDSRIQTIGYELQALKGDELEDDETDMANFIVDENY